MRIQLLSVVSVIAVLALEGSALAQGKTEPPKALAKESSFEVLIFPEDPLINSLIDPNQDRIKVGPSVKRVLLSRPRVSFVPELYKSIESL